MLKAIEVYLALRRATGFAMLNAEYLLKSFAVFATERGQTHVHTQTAIDWAARGPSVLPFELAIQLGPEEHRPGRIVQPEQEDDAGGE